MLRWRDLKNYKCTKMNAKGAITQSTNKWKTQSQNKWLRKTKDFSKLKCNLIKKMSFFFQFCKWIKREKQMQLLLIKFADKQISRASKLEKAYLGRSTSFKEMSSKKIGLLRSTQAEHRQDVLPTWVRLLQHALIT